MLPRILAWSTVAVSIVIAVVCLWPQGFGLQNQWIAAHVVALRGAAAVAATVGAILFGLLAIPKQTRWFGIAMAAVLAAFAVGNVAVLAVRGTGAEATATASDPDAVTVLSWNTLGEVPEAATIVDLALEQEADVIVLPETTEPLGEDVAVAMRDGGRPMWVHTQFFDQISKARSTTLLISPELGEYTVSSVPYPGPPNNTNTLPTVVADPVDGAGPRIVAVHAVAPIRWELRNWRSDLDWLATQCEGDNVIMAGDFNATLDHFAGRGVDGGDLGRCIDAADVAGSAALGTWPTFLPTLLGSPIDHVMATDAWAVEDFRVLDALDGSGSDHRPVVATLRRAG